MKPEATFTNGRITLLHMDCMEYMATLPDKAAVERFKRETAQVAMDL